MQFDLSRNIDSAARDVQAGINAARALLRPACPTIRPIARSTLPDAPVMILSLTFRHADRGQMYDAASTVLAQKISQVAGVGQVQVGGGALPAVRVELNLPALNRMGIGLETVRARLLPATPIGLRATSRTNAQLADLRQ